MYHSPAGQWETLQHKTTTLCFGLPPAGLGIHRPDRTLANHALTFKLEHTGGAGHRCIESFLDYTLMGNRERGRSQNLKLVQQIFRDF